MKPGYRPSSRKKTQYPPESGASGGIFPVWRPDTGLSGSVRSAARFKMLDNGRLKSRECVAALFGRKSSRAPLDSALFSALFFSSRVEYAQGWRGVKGEKEETGYGLRARAPGGILTVDFIEKAGIMKTRVYLDNCCFNRPFDDPATPLIRLEADAKLHIQKQILDGEIELAWSYILEHESAANPYESQRRSIVRWQRLAVVDVDEDREIVALASAIMKRGIRNMDALHIACAIKARCRYFLTTDRKVLKKRIAGITILNPMDYIREAEDGNEE